MMTGRANELSFIQTEKVSLNEVQPWLDEFRKFVQIPKGYDFHSISKVKVDNVPALLFRYEKQGNKGSKGEHFSFIISENEKQILGFTNMDKGYSNLKMLSKAETETTAKKFLLTLDGTLANNLKNLWIERHNEEILVNGQKTIIAGMKYKCFRASQNDYAWVIVGFDGSVITFERNIKWNNNEKRRITKKWLHDNWVSGNIPENN